MHHLHRLFPAPLAPQARCWDENLEAAKLTYFTYHSVPDVVNLFPVLPIGHQVEVVGELHSPGQLLQDVNAEPLATFLHLPPFVG